MKKGAIKQTTPVTYMARKKWGYKTDHPGNVCQTYTYGRHVIDVMH